MDNLSSNKRPAVRQAIRSVGAKLLFLPPYSPDLNPIEQVFAKLKHLVRKAAERTHDATWRRIGSSLDCFSPDEYANYLRDSGYAQTQSHQTLVIVTTVRTGRRGVLSCSGLASVTVAIPSLTSQWIWDKVTAGNSPFSRGRWPAR
jgi:hypothetical protein